MRTPLRARERSGETGQRRDGVGVEGSGSDLEDEEDDMSWMDGGEEMVDRSAQRSRSERSLNLCLKRSRTCRLGRYDSSPFTISLLQATRHRVSGRATECFHPRKTGGAGQTRVWTAADIEGCLSPSRLLTRVLPSDHQLALASDLKIICLDPEDSPASSSSRPSRSCRRSTVHTPLRTASGSKLCSALPLPPPSPASTSPPPSLPSIRSTACLNPKDTSCTSSSDEPTSRPAKVRSPAPPLPWSSTPSPDLALPLSLPSPQLESSPARTRHPTIRRTPSRSSSSSFRSSSSLPTSSPSGSPRSASPRSSQRSSVASCSDRPSLAASQASPTASFLRRVCRI